MWLEVSFQLIVSSLSFFKAAKGLSSSAIALAAVSSEIPHLRKQLVKVLSGSLFLAFESHIMAERIDIAGIEAFFSKLDINLLTTNKWYFTFNERIIHWPLSCVAEMVLGCRKINSTHSRCSTCGSALQLLIINTTFHLSIRYFRSSSRTYSSNSSDDIQLFNWDRYWQGKCFTLLKHLGFCDFPMTKIGSLSSKSLPAVSPVKHTSLCFPPEHFWLSQNHLHWKYLPMYTEKELKAK